MHPHRSRQNSAYSPSEIVFTVASLIRREQPLTTDEAPPHEPWTVVADAEANAPLDEEAGATAERPRVEQAGNGKTASQVFALDRGEAAGSLTCE